MLSGCAVLMVGHCIAVLTAVQCSAVHCSTLQCRCSGGGVTWDLVMPPFMLRSISGLTARPASFSLSPCITLFTSAQHALTQHASPQEHLVAVRFATVIMAQPKPAAVRLAAFVSLGRLAICITFQCKTLSTHIVHDAISKSVS